MTHTLIPPKLGKNILILTDNCSACLQMLGSVAASLPNLEQTRFTMLHCCPPVYWEHGGGPADQTHQETEEVWKEEEQEFRTTEWYFEQAKKILENAGVKPHHIELVKDPDHDDLLSAAMALLKQHSFTGVILHNRHSEIINRLERRGFTDTFRKVPEVVVWAIDDEMLKHAAAAEKVAHK